MLFLAIIRESNSTNKAAVFVRVHALKAIFHISCSTASKLYIYVIMFLGGEGDL